MVLGSSPMGLAPSPIPWNLERQHGFPVQYCIKGMCVWQICCRKNHSLLVKYVDRGRWFVFMTGWKGSCRKEVTDSTGMIPTVHCAIQYIVMPCTHCFNELQENSLTVLAVALCMEIHVCHYHSLGVCFIFLEVMWPSRKHTFLKNYNILCQIFCLCSQKSTRVML